MQNEEIDGERLEQKNLSCQMSFEKSCGTFIICNKAYKIQKGLERHRRMRYQHCAKELINKSILSQGLVKRQLLISVFHLQQGKLLIILNSLIKRPEIFFKKSSQLSSITIILINIFSIHLIYIQKISFLESRLVPRIVHCYNWS